MARPRSVPCDLGKTCDDMRHAGVRWKQIAYQLGFGMSTCQKAWREYRDAGEIVYKHLSVLPQPKGIEKPRQAETLLG